MGGHVTRPVRSTGGDLAALWSVREPGATSGAHLATHLARRSTSGAVDWVGRKLERGPLARWRQLGGNVAHLGHTLGSNLHSSLPVWWPLLVELRATTVCG